MVLTTLFSHPDCLDHLTPQGHPEQVDRLRSIERRLASPEFDNLRRMQAPISREVDILRCHSRSYLEHLQKSSPVDGIAHLDADTHMSEGSLTAAYRGVGANTAAVDMVLQGSTRNAFVACRPPGHHAETSKAMGFCLFGNVSIAAKYALDVGNLDRVAVIDFDVHHGNGTQNLLWDETRALFCSTHQMPLFPGSGDVGETGKDGNVLNQPLLANSNGTEMRRVYDNVIFPAVTDFNPALILVSAGFDAHQSDPLANLNWNTQDFAWLTGRICDVAENCCDGRIVSTLEGGYDLTALADSVAAHIAVLMERS